MPRHHHVPAKYRTAITPAQLAAYRRLQARYGPERLSPLPPYTLSGPGRVKPGAYLPVILYTADPIYGERSPDTMTLYFGIEPDGYTHT